MTIHRDLNRVNNDLGGTGFFFWVTRMLLDNGGATVRSSGSGVGGIYEPSGNVFGMSSAIRYITHPGSGGISGGEIWGQTGMWIVIQLTSGQELLFRRSPVSNSQAWDGYWYVSYSRADGFTTGTPGPAAPPNAPDEQTLSVGGTKGVPVGMNAGSDTQTLLHIVYDDEASDGGINGLYAVEIKATNTYSCALWIDDLKQTATGDLEGCVLAHSYYDHRASWMSSGTHAPKGWSNVGLPGENWNFTSYALCSSSSAFYSAIGINSVYDSKERTVDILAIADPAGSFNVGGLLGVSRWFKSPTIVRDYPNTMDSALYLHMNDIVIADLMGGTTPTAIT